MAKPTKDQAAALLRSLWSVPPDEVGPGYVQVCLVGAYREEVQGDLDWYLRVYADDLERSAFHLTGEYRAHVPYVTVRVAVDG